MPAPHSSEERRAEWSMVRKTGLLGDVVDEAAFARMCGMPRKTLRNHRTKKGAYLGVEIPTPIARAENNKPIFLKREAEACATKLKAAMAARRKR